MSAIKRLTQYFSKEARSERAALRQQFNKAVGVLKPVINLTMQSEAKGSLAPEHQESAEYLRRIAPELEMFFSEEYFKSAFRANSAYHRYVAPQTDGFITGAAQRIIFDAAKKIGAQDGLDKKAARAQAAERVIKNAETCWREGRALDILYLINNNPAP